MLGQLSVLCDTLRTAVWWCVAPITVGSVITVLHVARILVSNQWGKEPLLIAHPMVLQHSTAPAGNTAKPQWSLKVSEASHGMFATLCRASTQRTK